METGMTSDSSIKSTPWGPAQTVHTIAPGITAVTTASHGGILVSEARWQRMLPTVRAYAQQWAAPRWFEEECAAILVMLAFPSAFPASQIASARRCAQTLRQHATAFGDALDAHDAETTA